MYKRKIEQNINKNLFVGKIIVIYGLRQVGKTTLVKKIFDEYKGKKLYFQADIPSEREIFKDPEPDKILKYIVDAKLVIIDEAQLINNIGVVLKVVHDKYPDIQFIVTCSSSFDLSNKIREPLTGRAIEYMLYPLSFEEIKDQKGLVYTKNNFDNFMKYGWYPGIVDIGSQKAIQDLGLLQNNTLYKDIFTLENIKKPKVLVDIATFLAYNIGSLVKVGSIAREVKTTEKTVERYIDLLEKMFVIIKIYSYSKNPNNEIKKGFKVYFTDIGFRNSLVKNYNNPNERTDKGALFENFFVVERLKYLSNNFIFTNSYFWQNYNQNEVDYIEERGGKLEAFECKYLQRNTKSINLFVEQYKDRVSETHVVDINNYINFISQISFGRGMNSESGILDTESRIMNQDHTTTSLKFET